MKKAEQYKVVELGTTYQLPKYRVVDGKGIQKVADCNLQDDPNLEFHITSEIYKNITFVRGDKSDNGTVIPRVDGILHEQLLGMMIEDLKYKNNLVPSRESSVAITKLEEALMWLEQRSYIREKEGTIGTYKK
ncbi:MAG: DUF7681 family protein [Bacteroidales bacterium]